MKSLYRRDSIIKEEVDQLIVNDFRKNRCGKLKNIVRQWNSSHYFKLRKCVFHEALVNHVRRYFNASITLLSVHTEGVITDFMRLGLQDPKYRANTAIEEIEKSLGSLPMSLLPYRDYKVYSSVLEKISAAFLESFNCANPDAVSNNSRHKIAHGHFTEAGTEAISLKKFLYLNEVFRMFSKLDEMIAKDNEVASKGNRIVPFTISGGRTI